MCTRLRAAATAAAANKHNHLAIGIEKVGLVSNLGIEKIRSVSNFGIKKSDRYRTSVSKNRIGIEPRYRKNQIGVEKIGPVSNIGINPNTLTLWPLDPYSIMGG